MRVTVSRGLDEKHREVQKKTGRHRVVPARISKSIWRAYCTVNSNATANAMTDEVPTERASAEV